MLHRKGQKKYWTELSLLGQEPTFNVGVKNHNFKFPLILDKYNIMIVMQKLKFMQEFTFAINVECLHSSFQAKLLLHNCARAKNAKTRFPRI